MIRLAPGLKVTADIFTTASAIIGIRGSGKTTDGVVLAEQAIGHGVPVAIIDPTGAWYGLKSSADGKSAGLPVYVFGGRHADAPLEATAGPIIARFAVERGVPIVLDLSDLSKSMQRRFVGQFCETLYDLKARARDPLFVIIDECPRFCPQQLQKDVDLAKCVGAVEDIVALGRSRGLGCAIIGQRPATINKNILTQADNLFAMRTVGTQDRKAIDDWVTEAQGDQEQRDELVQNIAALPQGEGYFWSPAIFGIFKRVQFDNRTTFDSSRTPKVGEKRIEPKVFASVDLEALSAEIRATVERAKADDPKELRKQIAELKRKAQTAPATVEKVTEHIEVPVLPDSVRGELREIVAGIGSLLDRFVGITDQIQGALARVQRPASVITPPPRREPVRAERQGEKRVELNEGAEAPLKAGARRMLQVLARYGGKLSKRQLATLSDVNLSSGTFYGYLSSLRVRGLVTDEREEVTLTSDGSVFIGEPIRSEPMTSGEIVATFSPKLKAGAKRMLELLVDAYPSNISKKELAEQAEVNIESGTFYGYLSSLRSNGLVEDDKGTARASPTLFLNEYA